MKALPANQQLHAVAEGCLPSIKRIRWGVSKLGFTRNATVSQGMKMTSGNPEGLNFREFLLCLSIGSVLQLFPLMKAYSSHELPA